MTGFTLGEGDDWRQGLRIEDVRKFDKLLRENIGALKSFQAEFEYKRKDGNYIWLLGQVAFLSDRVRSITLGVTLLLLLLFTPRE